MVLLSLLILTHLDATNVVAFPVRHCETELSPERFVHHGVEALIVAPFDVRALLAEHVTNTARAAYGLDFLHAWFGAESLAVRMRVTRNRWRIEIVSRPSRKAIFSYELDDASMHEWHLSENTKPRAFGVTWPGRAGRYFLSVLAEGASRHYALGLDVPCRDLRRFSLGTIAEIVQSEGVWLCRVPVLTFRRKP